MISCNSLIGPANKRKNYAEKISVSPKILLSWLKFDQEKGQSEKGKRYESLNCGTVLPQSYAPKAWIKSSGVWE